MIKLEHSAAIMMRGFVLAALLIAAATAVPAGRANAQEKPLATLAEVRHELRQGGLVIYLRHAVTDQAGANDAPEDLTSCDRQRHLSAKGKADALQIGESIKALGIPIGTVTTSPYCRAKDTARLSFGRFVENPDLGFVIGSTSAETRRRTESLRRMLGTPPEKGTNNVVVSHSANLLEAADIFAKPEGAAYIFRPLANGQFQPLARILPEDWVAARIRSSAPLVPRPATDK